MSASPTILLPLATSTTSESSQEIAMYPTSPLGIFPPPAPVVRCSLRDRRGFNLTLQIDGPLNSNVFGPWSPKGHLQPHRTNLPRRRNPKPRFVHYHPESPKVPVPPTPPQLPALPTPLRPPKVEEPHLQAIIPALWVAFGREGQSERTYEEGFTHIVEIRYSNGEPYSSGSTERRYDGRVQRLILVLPELARKWLGRAALALSDAQLRTARDFMAEALPPDVASMPDQNDVRVLIVVPPGRPTDAMCILGCYLSFAAGRGADAILKCIDEEESILSVWKGEVSGNEMERIERIARSWSWLATVAVRK